jgi:hypothetical protein
MNRSEKCLPLFLREGTSSFTRFDAGPFTSGFHPVMHTSVRARAGSARGAAIFPRWQHGVMAHGAKIERNLAAKLRENQ